MIVENDCLILQNLPDKRWRNQRRGSDECDDPPAGRTRGTAGASQPRGTGCTDRASHPRRWDRPVAPRVAPIPLFLASKACSQCARAIRVRDCSGEQGGPSRREPGGRLRHLALQGGYTPHIARAVGRLRQDFDQPLHIEELARELGMSVSGFYHHFKAVTAMSPLQFQKRLRLQEARRLMLGEDLDAASAAYRVGYHDASHFNREYKSLFGVPPMRDVQRLREEALAFPRQ